MNSFKFNSIQKLTIRTLSHVKTGRLSHIEARCYLQRQTRHSGQFREDLINELTQNYDPEATKALQYFQLI